MGSETKDFKGWGIYLPPPPDIQALLDRYAMLFGDIPPGQQLDRGFEHTIELEPSM